MTNRPVNFNDPSGHIKCEFDEQGNDYCYENDRKTKIIKSFGGDGRDREIDGYDQPDRPGWCDRPHCYDERGDPLPNPPSFEEIVEEEVWLLKYALQGLDYISSYEDIINSYRPAYKQIKYAFGTGPFEAIVDGVIYGVKDRWSASLTPEQRVLRAGIVATESFLIDRLSNKVGALGIPFGGKAGEIAVQYIFSAAVSEYVLPQTTYWIFDAMNLGVPQDISPLIP